MDLEQRPKNLDLPCQEEGFPGKIESNSTESKRQKKLFQDKNFCCCCCCCCWRVPRFPERFSLLDSDSRSWIGSGFVDPEEVQGENWGRFKPRRNCRSNPNFPMMIAFKKAFNDEREFHNARTRRPLNFELSESGIDSVWEEKGQRKRPEKMANRSISMDSVKTEIEYDRLGESHRRVLAQAVYEEWYFKKEKELCMKRNRERLTRLKTKESIRDQVERKKEQCQEEYQKWLRKKITKRRKKEKSFAQSQTNSFEKLSKTKEESEKAFANWKKTKDKELKKKKNDKEKEEKRKLKSEKEKKEKKIMAEKAYQQWKTKLLKEGKKGRQNARQEPQERRKKKEKLQISFEMWKAVKDEQIKEKTKKTRMESKVARQERLAQIEERLYESEQAFEDWLEKIESRKQKQLSGMNVCNKTIPWIPV